MDWSGALDVVGGMWLDPMIGKKAACERDKIDCRGGLLAPSDDMS